MLEGKEIYIKSKGVKKMTREEFLKLQKAEIEITNNNTFKRQFGSVYVLNQKKIIKNITKRRILDENGVFNPHSNI